MSALALDHLIEREEALVAALDGGDMPALAAATHGMRDAIAEVAASGGWHLHPELGARVIQALRLAEAAGGRINYLADRNRRQLDRLAEIVGKPRAVAYGRNGYTR